MQPSLLLTQDGSHSVFAPQFGATYHSKYGAIGETRHVFIQAGLLAKATVQTDLAILDIGFGTGLNAYLTYWEARQRRLSIRYTAVEAYPILPETAAALNYAALLDIAPDDDVLPAMHAQLWDTTASYGEAFLLEKRLCRFETLADDSRYDLIYFDAFAPDAQPELWGVPMMERMYKALKPQGILTTYCAKGDVRRAMKAAGFIVEKLPGPIGKREMTRAVKLL